MTQPTYFSTLTEYNDPLSPSSPLPSLYSSLSSLRKSNPSAYRTNVEWWTRTLTGAVAYGTRGKGKQRESADAERLVLTIDEELLESWTVEDVGRPMGIATVVAELAASRRVVRLNQFLTSSAPCTPTSSSSRLPSARSVAAFVVGKPLWWALGQLGIAGGGDDDDDEDDVREWRSVKGQWVVSDLVQTTADAVLAEHYTTSGLSPLDSLYTLSAFKSLVTRVAPTLTQLDIQVLLKHLSRDRHAAHVQGSLIKLSPTSHEPVTAITTDDRNLIAVRETRDKLDLQITDLTNRLTSLTSRISTALKTKPTQRTQALTLLKEKKSIQDLLDRRLASKSTLESVLLKIEQAAGDVEIMRSFETSTDVLRRLLGKDELQLDRVERTVEQLQDVMADQAEIDGVIRGGVDSGGIDEEDLEREMRDLEEQERREGEQREERERGEREQREKEERNRRDKEKSQAQAQAEQQRKETPTETTQQTPEKEKQAVTVGE